MLHRNPVAETPELSKRTVDRVHLLKEDLDWAPTAILRLNKLVVASLVVGATVPAFLKFGPMVWFVPGIVAPFALRVGNRSARALVRRRLSRYARGEVDLSSLRNEIDGELLQVSGTVDATDTVSGLLDPVPCVYRRLQVSLGRIQLIHEAAVDFTLTDDSGQRVKVLASGSRLLCPISKRYLIESEAESRVLAEVRRTHIDKLLHQHGLEHFEVMGDEFLVRAGHRVDVVGYKTRVVDQRLEERLARDNPFRAALRSGEKLPLLIAAKGSDDAP
jgi:hypothetical protein